MKFVVCALVTVAVLLKRLLKIERTLALAKRGAESTTKDTNPVKSLKNMMFLAFFVLYGLTAEEGSVL